MAPFNMVRDEDERTGTGTELAAYCGVFRDRSRVGAVVTVFRTAATTVKFPLAAKQL